MKEGIPFHMQSAFYGDNEMPLMNSAEGITQAEAEWKMNDTPRTIEEILYHVVSEKYFTASMVFRT